MTSPNSQNSGFTSLATRRRPFRKSKSSTLAELDRVCRSGGTIIVPTYMNRSEQGKTSGFASTVGKAGADFKRQFTFDTYKQFIAAAGYDDVDYAYCPGRVPCAVAVIHKP